jgi:hypothetical protein
MSYIVYEVVCFYTLEMRTFLGREAIGGISPKEAFLECAAPCLYFDKAGYFLGAFFKIVCAVVIRAFYPLLRS